MVMGMVLTRVQEAIHDMNSGITGDHVGHQDVMMVNSNFSFDHRWLVGTRNGQGELVSPDVCMDTMILEACREFEVCIRYYLAI